ncbi:hypothetical protein BSKO_04631 [Bryopsis sp. KO-2023]|nr:hypothetical protein BSKO_04631 [Bryopsis sp. KO-2023]
MPPIINDVATDLEDTPAFVKASVGELPDSFKEQIKKAYADLKPLVLESQDKPTVFKTAAKLAEETARWQVTHQDEEAGIIEGVATTGLLRFKDDFVVRIKDAEGSGVVVDMRSKSRVGKGDLGANAARIREYFAALTKAVSSE